MNLVSSSHFFPRENQLRNEIRCLSFLITVHIVTAFWLNQEQTVQLRKYDRMQWKYPQAVTECSESTHSQWQNAVKVPISRAHGPWVPVVQWTCYQCQYFDSARVVMASYSNWWICFLYVSVQSCGSLRRTEKKFQICTKRQYFANIPACSCAVICLVHFDPQLNSVRTWLACSSSRTVYRFSLISVKTNISSYLRA